MEQLATLVKSNYGHSVGRALPEAQLKEQEQRAKKVLQ